MLCTVKEALAFKIKIFTTWEIESAIFSTTLLVFCTCLCLIFEINKVDNFPGVICPRTYFVFAIFLRRLFLGETRHCNFRNIQFFNYLGVVFPRELFLVLSILRTTHRFAKWGGTHYIMHRLYRYPCILLTTQSHSVLSKHFPLVPLFGSFCGRTQCWLRVQSVVLSTEATQSPAISLLQSIGFPCPVQGVSCCRLHFTLHWKQWKVSDRLWIERQGVDSWSRLSFSSRLTSLYWEYFETLIVAQFTKKLYAFMKSKDQLQCSEELNIGYRIERVISVLHIFSI